MKKKYIKPEIMFESFTLSTNIAGDCTQPNSLQSENVCGLDFGGDIIFLTGVTGCELQFETDDGSSGVCYHNPYATSLLFNS